MSKKQQEPVDKPAHEKVNEARPKSIYANMMVENITKIHDDLKQKRREILDATPAEEKQKWYKGLSEMDEHKREIPGTAREAEDKPQELRLLEQRINCAAKELAKWEEIKAQYDTYIPIWQAENDAQKAEAEAIKEDDTREKLMLKK